ncbi:hypothetical protein [Pedobacter montanisoli]|uniref:CHAD domain-containing protein n=1 Tax=Pedobacter montanisoli TaxID=2923277 RepID=A0ABS9ZW22_9SPHI|nr:hypothetical protein [Pedobacter montanisoli]MCJ0742501.1 hypothetical protein [Pedobacter montanisoli]
MKLSEHQELKQAILSLPVKEKDKLLLRLVAKDKVLTERLHFMLLEDESNLEERVGHLEAEIKDVCEALRTQPKLTAKDVLLSLRKLNKEINHFAKVTKSDFEEIRLKLQVLKHAPLKFKFKLFSSARNYEQTLASYVVKSVLNIHKKFVKLHEDLRFDLTGDFNELLEHIYQSDAAFTAKELKLPKEI